MASRDMGRLISPTEADLQAEPIKNAQSFPRKQSTSSDDGIPVLKTETCFYSLKTTTGAYNNDEICEAELATLRNASKSQVADESAKSSIRSAHIRSARSSGSLRAIGHEQEQARTDYLQAQGYTLAFSRSSTDTDITIGSNRTDLESRIDVTGQELHLFQAQNESSTSTIHNLQAPALNSIEVAESMDIPTCRSSLREIETPTTAPTQLQDAPTTSQHSRRFKMRRTFKAARALEAGNWFEGPGRGSQTLPLPRRFPIYEAVPEDLHTSSPPYGNRTSVLDELKFWRLPRSASLRIRNDRLPPAYIQPADRDVLVGGAGVTVSGKRSDEFVRGVLESVSPLTRTGATPLIPDPDEDDDAISEPLELGIRTSPEHRGQTGGTQRPPDLTVDTTMTDALGTQEVLPFGLTQSSRFSTDSEEENVGERPSISVLSPDKPSGRNSAMTASNQKSAIWPVPEPMGSPVPGRPAVKSTSVTKSGRPWWADCFLAALWAVTTALTLFGLSGTSPLYQPAACTIEEMRPRSSPSFSFTHRLQLTTTLPEVLRPVFPILRRQGLQSLDLMDHGLKVEVEANGGSHDQEVLGGLTIGSSFSDSGEALVCDVTYAAVVDGEGAGDGRQKLEHMMDETSYNSVKAVKVVLARSTSRELDDNVSSVQAGHIFLPLWLACLLAVEMILPIYFVVLRLVWMATVHLFRCCRLKKWEETTILREDINWKQEVLVTTALTCRWVLAGAMGSAVAGSILVAFWA